MTTPITICKAADVKLDHDRGSVTLPCNNFLKGLPVGCNCGDWGIRRRVSVVVIRAGWRCSREDGGTNMMKTRRGEQSNEPYFRLYSSCTSRFLISFIIVCRDNLFFFYCSKWMRCNLYKFFWKKLFQTLTTHDSVNYLLLQTMVEVRNYSVAEKNFSCSSLYYDIRRWRIN